MSLIQRCAIWMMVCGLALLVVLSGCVLLPGPIGNGIAAASLWHTATAGRSTTDLIASATLGQDCKLIRIAIFEPPCS